MKHSKFIVAAGGILVILFVLARYTPIPKNADMPMWFLTTRLNDVVRKYGKMNSICSFVIQEDIQWCVNATNENKKNLSNLNKNQGVLYIDFTGKPHKYNEPIEIYAMFECFLYLNERITPKEIVAITCISQSGEWGDADSTHVTITTKEYKSLYNSININGKTNASISKELAEIWINKHFYNRSKLNFTMQNKFMKKLVTPWKKVQMSYDGDFSMHYGYDTNKLSIDRITKIQGSDMTMNTSLLDFKVDETGVIYGTWDEQNNIWLYGDDIGLRMYEFNGDNDWEPVYSINEDDIPHDLKMVLSRLTKSIKRANG